MEWYMCIEGYNILKDGDEFVVEETGRKFDDINECRYRCKIDDVKVI